MLYNSFVFVLLFLPATLAGFALLQQRRSVCMCLAWLTATSLLFYAWWNPWYLLLIATSVCLNYGCVRLMEKVPNRKTLLVAGITLNLLLLGYFKYVDFAIETLNNTMGANIPLHNVVLPLAISFFTFQQIAYLTDEYRGNTSHHTFLEYCFFITFFPQLIAGPIVRHGEIFPQLNEDSLNTNVRNITIGITIFVIGLAKKVILADNLEQIATPLFGVAEQGFSVPSHYAWMGTIAFGLQLYFDFSGYTDMAIGAARMFGVRLPLNFNAPYKAPSIIDFWRRWHQTFYRFLRDYLYIPLGGNQKGTMRTFSNIMIVTLLAGLWHGAAWTFVMWGAIHGVLLSLNHLWRMTALNTVVKVPLLVRNTIGTALTFLCVTLAWILFRAQTFGGAFAIYLSMIGNSPQEVATYGIRFLQTLTKMGLYSTDRLSQTTFRYAMEIAEWPATSMTWIIIGLFVVFFLPTTQQFMRFFKPVYNQDCSVIPPHPLKLHWSPTLLWGIILGVTTCICLYLISTDQMEFIYFNF